MTPGTVEARARLNPTAPGHHPAHHCPRPEAGWTRNAEQSPEPGFTRSPSAAPARRPPPKAGQKRNRPARGRTKQT